MAITSILFLLGFFFLIKGADLLVEGASCIARRLRISNLVVGLTIVSFGTSLPEMVVNLFASGQGNTELAIGNIIGSNIANILLILGIAAIIYPLAVSKGTVWREIPMSLLAIVMLAILANDIFLNGIGVDLISRSDGMVMIAFLIIFMYYIYGVAQKDRRKKVVEEAELRPAPKALLFIAIGIIGLVVGGNWVVDGAVALASWIGISTTFIGLSVVALGTSLPELVTSAVAAYKHNAELAVGNAVGSNIFNVFWILAISAIVRPLPFMDASNFDLAVAIAATLLLFAWMFIGKKQQIERWQGVMFVCSYICYIAFIAIRG